MGTWHPVADLWPEKKKKIRNYLFFFREINLLNETANIIKGSLSPTPPQIVISSENLAIYCKRPRPIKSQFF